MDEATLRVKGLSNVAVGDASLLLGQVWAHPAMSLMALAHRVSDVLLDRISCSLGKCVSPLD